MLYIPLSHSGDHHALAHLSVANIARLTDLLLLLFHHKHRSLSALTTVQQHPDDCVHGMREKNKVSVVLLLSF